VCSLLTLRVALQRALKHKQEKALQELDAAVAIGDIDVVRMLLARGLPVNAGDHDKRTALVRLRSPSVFVMHLLAKSWSQI
jgi:hypothetical protein